MYTLMGHVDNENTAHLGAGNIGEIFVPSPQFCCEPETAPKKNDLLKNIWGEKAID